METYKTLPRISLVEALRNSYKEKFVHDMGRSRRSEFWWTTLVYWLLTAALSVGFFLLQVVPLVGYAIIATSIYITCVQIFAFVRRLHDSGHSGYWWLIIPIGNFCSGIISTTVAWLPIVSLVCLGIMIYFGVLDSDEGDNEYGEATKYVPIEEEVTV